MPDKPTLLWDGECGFCARWIRRWQKATGEAVEYRRYQEALAAFPQVSPEDCAAAVQLILPDGRVVAAAHAVLMALAIGGHARQVLALYERSEIFRRCADTAYRFVAAHRSWLPS